VAIPALNEATTITNVINEVRAAAPFADILVVDDGSRDATAKVASAGGAVVLRLPFNVGVGGAMRTGFLYAQRNGYNRVIQVDADGQHDPAYIHDILQSLEHHSVVIGARFAEKGEFAVRGPRKWAMWILAKTLSRVARTPLTDTTSGFRGADEQAIALFAVHYPAEYLGDTVESLVIACRAGLSVVQVPVEMRQRQGGKPSQSPFWAGLFLGRALLALFSALGRRYDIHPSTAGG
jgi:glycosyltransferase involved in cell wall biosynthesis